MSVFLEVSEQQKGDVWEGLLTSANADTGQGLTDHSSVGVQSMKKRYGARHDWLVDLKR